MAGTLSAAIAIGQATAPQFSGSSALTAELVGAIARAAALSGDSDLDALFRPQFSQANAQSGSGTYAPTTKQKYNLAAALAGLGALTAAIEGHVTGISFVSGNASAGNTTPMSAHQAGDLIVAFAFRDGSNTAPGAPAGYYSDTIEGGGFDAKSGTLAMKYAQSSSETTGTFSNATGVAVAVYRNAWVVAESAAALEDSGTTITYPEVPLDYLTGVSPSFVPLYLPGWVVRVAGHRSASNLLSTTPAGHVARSGVATECRIIDSGTEQEYLPEISQTTNSSGQWVAMTTKIFTKTQGLALSDDFSTGTEPDPAKWITTLGTSGVVSLVGQRLRITGISQPTVVHTKDAVTLSGRSLTVQVPGYVPGSGTVIRTFVFGIGDGYDDLPGTMNSIAIVTTNANQTTNTHTLIRNFNGTSTAVATRTFAAGNWYRMTESGGTVTVQTSTDGSSWTTWATISVGVNPPVGRVFMGFATTGSGGYIEFDNFELT